VAESLEVLDIVLKQMDLEFVGRGKHKISVEELFSAPDGLLLDIRTAAEQRSLPLCFPGQVSILHIPLDELPMRWGEVIDEAAVGIFCPHGVRASIAYTYLHARGKTNVRVLDGGYAGIAEMARPGAVLASLKARG